MAPDVNHSFTTVASSDATLSGLTISQGTLSPAFAQDIDTYTASVANSVESVTLTASVNEPHASMTLKKDGDAEVWDGAASVQSLSVGANVFTVTVTAQDGTTTKTYTITVTRAARRSSGGSGSSTPDYRADVSRGRNLPVTINSCAHNASVDISAQLGSSITSGGTRSSPCPP